MDAPWGCSAAYTYVLGLEPAFRAWEFLRRNPQYVSDWERHRRRASRRVAKRWGLAAPINPRLDAREARPVWVIGAPSPITLVRDEMNWSRKRVTGAERFSLWRLAGYQTLFHDGSALQLVVRAMSQEVQLRLAESLRDGDRFAYHIPGAANDRATWAALIAFRALPVSRDARASPLERPGRTDLFHARALQVLDGLAAGASQRDLARALCGRAAVARGWQPDSALRAQVRYLIRSARALRDRGYRSLISHITLQ